MKFGTLFLVTARAASAQSVLPILGSSVSPSTACGGNGFGKCHVLTIDHTQAGTADTTNWTGIYSGTVADWADTGHGGSVQHTGTQSGGSYTSTIPYDWWVTSDSGCTTQVAGVDFESYTNTTGAVIFHFLVATLSHTTNTTYYICSGKSTITTQQNTVTSAYDTNIKMMLHLPNGTTLNYTDSTTNANNGAACANAPTATTGEIDGGAAFNGTNQCFFVADALSNRISTNIFTVQFWAKLANTTQTSTYVMSKDTIGTNQQSIIYGYVANDYEFYAPGFTGTDPRTGSQINVADTNWHLIAYTYDGTTWSGYLDGSAVFSVARSFTLSVPTASWYMSSAQGGSQWWAGSMDQIVLSNSAAFSASHELADYNNQKASQTMITEV